MIFVKDVDYSENRIIKKYLQKLSNKHDWKKIISVVSKKVNKNLKSHDFNHIINVLNYSYKLSKFYKVDYDYLFLIIILHDLNVSIENLKNHNLVSAKEAKEFLYKLSFEKKLINKIVFSIKNHVKSYTLKHNYLNKLDIETKILCDSDRLDSLGSIGIIRMTEISIKQNIPYFISRNDKLNQSYYGNFKWLEKISNNFYLKESKKLSKDKSKIIKEFNKIFLKEFNN